MYRTGEKKTSTGMASWFSVENWNDGPSLRDDGTQVYIKRSQHLDQYVSRLSMKKSVAIAKGALEIRAVMKEQKKVRKGKQRAVMMERPADDSNDDEDWEENMRSDPVNPDEQ